MACQALSQGRHLVLGMIDNIRESQAYDKYIVLIQLLLCVGTECFTCIDSSMKCKLLWSPPLYMKKDGATKVKSCAQDHSAWKQQSWDPPGAVWLLRPDFQASAFCCLSQAAV